jgi:molybdenum cofactor cytidylyltransferase
VVPRLASTRSFPKLQYTRMRIAGLILAGGESLRMKSPKALLQIGHQTFVERLLDIMRQAGIDPVVVVAGAHYPEIDRHLGGRCTVVLNLDYRHGQFSSLQTGLRELRTPLEPPTGVVVWPVDQPLVQPETLATLLSGFGRFGAPVTVPVHQRRRGHPVVYSMEAVEEILSMDATRTGKDVAEFYTARICYVDVNDPGILIDIDTPEEYRKYAGSTP